MPASKPPTLQLVQVFRGAAALLVMLYHVGQVNHFYFPFAGNVFKWGHSGIDFFFVLSGFIMLFVHYERAGDAPYAGRFLALRAIRIYPIYWCVLAVTVAMVWAHPPPPDNQWAPPSTLAAPTLIHAALLYGQQHDAIVPVAWTLTYELAFYGFFATYLLFGARAFTVLALVWSGLIALQWAGLVDLGSHPVLLRPLVLEFLLGCVAALAVRRWTPHRVSGWWVLAAVGTVLAVAYGELVEAIDGYTWWWAPYFVLILAGAAYDHARRRRYPRLLVLLGEASYVIYLIHYGMVVVFARTIDAYRPTASLAPNLTLSLLAIAIVVTGIAVHLTIERPLLAWARRRLGR
ncbi:MAG TPA: acyltransferase [Candidatus Binatia bacterium]